MKKMLCAVLFCAVAAIFVQPVSSEPLAKAEAPVLIPGESWVWNDGWADWSETFAGEKDGLLVFNVSSGTQKFRTKGDLNLVKEVAADGTVIREHKPHNGQLNFPLFVGKSYKLSYNHDNKLRDASYEVVGVKTITTKAGKFECIVIAGSESGTQETAIKIWYSPTAKHIVKMTAETVGGKRSGKKVEGKNYEMTDYKQPPTAVVK